jgi:hypothetical protein
MDLPLGSFCRFKVRVVASILLPLPLDDIIIIILAPPSPRGRFVLWLLSSSKSIMSGLALVGVLVLHPEGGGGGGMTTIASSMREREQPRESRTEKR